MKHLLLSAIAISVLVVSVQASFGVLGQRTSARARSITGRVVNDSEQPIPNAYVTVRTLGAVSTRAFRDTRTDDTGRFRLDGLSPAAYTIFASAPGYTTESDGSRATIYRIGADVTLELIKGGVITGTVTGSTGEPLAGVRVNAMRVRFANGRPVRGPGGAPTRDTDDRGVYRFWALPPGTYVVYAGASRMFSTATGTPYDNDVPTYHPSSTRDTATEVRVQNSQEAAGVDIRYRGEPGHAVSGVVTQPQVKAGAAAPNPASIQLRSLTGAHAEWSAFTAPRGADNSFAIYGVPDGEYELVAVRDFGEQGAASAPRRVAVKGSDVTGIELVLAPLSSISGRMNLVPLAENARKPDCSDRPGALLQETALFVQRDERPGRQEPPSGSSRSNLLDWTVVDEKGEFVSYGMNPGRYRLQAKLPVDTWYVKSITLPATQTQARETDLARNGLVLNQSEQFKGVVITVAQGGAAISGRVAPSPEKSPLPPRLLVHLVPAEREAANDVLRFHEVRAERDGAFTLGNVAPGRYWVIARPEPDESRSEPRPAAWDSSRRRQLRAEAEAANAVIELQPCQRVTNHVLRYSTAGPVRPTPAPAPAM